jgi:capsular polysaccharide transport system ATP-binding protein
MTSSCKRNGVALINQDDEPVVDPADKSAAKQRRGRPWQKGVSGNPAGCQTGSRHRVTVMLEQLMAGDAEAVVRAVVSKATSGDMTAARIVVDRLLPLRRGRPVQLALPSIKGVWDLMAAQAIVTQALATGEVTAEEAASVSAVLDSGNIIRDVSVSFPLGFSGTFDLFLTGRENALFIARLYRLEWKPYVAFVQEFTELGKFFDQPVKTYSSGMRARLAFATSIAANFDVYLVDEIMSVGDARFRGRCAEAFANRRNYSDVIMVSHNVRTIRRYCDAGAVLFNGHLEPYEDVDEAIAVYNKLCHT